MYKLIQQQEQQELSSLVSQSRSHSLVFLDRRIVDAQREQKLRFVVEGNATTTFGDVAAALMQSRAGAVAGAAAAAAAAAAATGTEVPCSRAPGPLLDRRLKPHAEQPQKCPRCDSVNTKFCYYNNYSLSQPRYFCKTCRRYWTKGGTLRNVPVGGGCRKNKRAKRSVDQAPSSHGGGGGGGAASSDEQTSPSDTANPNNSSNLSNPTLNPSSNPSPSLDSDQAGVSGSSMYGFEELSAAAAAAAAAGYGFNPSSRTAVMVSGPLQQLSSLSPLAGLQSALKVGFPGLPDQSSGLSSMADLSCILQQQAVQIGGLTMPLDAYGAIDPQWQRLMQQQQQQNLRPPPPLDDRQVSLLPLDLQQQQSGKASEEANRARIVAGQSQNWQIPQEGFFEASSTDTHNASPFWNTATTGAGVAGSSWPDLSGFGPSSSGSLL